jgi:hypothetical protein
MNRFHPGMRTVAAVLCFLLTDVGASDLMAQTAAPPPHLQITILDGEGALNNIKQRVAREPIVQVEDENHKPVAGAVVIFLLPDSGPGGTFLDGTNMFTTTTDAEGKAVASDLKPNNVAGKFQIRVRVKHGDDTAEATIAQTNLIGAVSGGGAAAHAFPAKWVIVGIAAAGGLAAGIIASKGGSHSTTITPGTPTVGAP